MSFDLSLADVRAEIEAEREWREKELRLLRNQCSLIHKEVDREIFRKFMVVALYAHFEGLTRAIFRVYIRGISRCDLNAKDLVSPLAAATLADVFYRLRDPQIKCAVFKKELLEDAKLHRFSRDCEFLERIRDFDEIPVNLEDDLVDTESNLKPVVLKKILYRLGFEPNLVEAMKGPIDKLLRFRNDVAHGSRRNGYTERDYQELEDVVFQVVDQITEIITQAVHEKSYLKSSFVQVPQLQASQPE